MRVSVRGLDDVFIYPCTKTDVREVFGEETLELAWFGGDHGWSRRETPGDIKGTVLMVLGVSTSPRPPNRPMPSASLHVYRMRKSAWSELPRWHIRESMRLKMRPWAEAMLARPETAWLGYERMFLELREGKLLTHARRGLD